MTMQDQSTDLVRQGQAVWTNAADSWTQTMQRMFAQTPAGSLGPFDVNHAVDLWFDFAAGLLSANREFAKHLARTASLISSTMSEQVGGAIRQQTDTTVDVVHKQAERAGQTERDAARRDAARRDEARRDEARKDEARKDEARKDEARKDEAKKQDRAEREEPGPADSDARERLSEKYSDMTKAQLQEALAERDLPKTGTVDELRERLIETELSGSTA